MALNVISNFAANIAHRNLRSSDGATTSSLNKLSSGSRVVSAKDDAASMAIGSSLKAEVMAMEQATVNARQAGSLLQIADGAMANVSEILVRAKMLAVQASSGQFSSTERQMFDNEYQSLLAEIDRISMTTKFAGNLLVNGTVSVDKQINGINFPSSSFTYQNFVSAKAGFQDITFEEDVQSSVFRFGYNQLTRALTAYNLDTKTSQTVILANRSIVEGRLETVKFSQLGLTVSLNNLFSKGSSGFPTPTGFDPAYDGGLGASPIYANPRRAFALTPGSAQFGISVNGVVFSSAALSDLAAAINNSANPAASHLTANVPAVSVTVTPNAGTLDIDTATIGSGAVIGDIATIDITIDGTTSKLNLAAAPANAADLATKIGAALTAAGITTVAATEAGGVVTLTPTGVTLNNAGFSTGKIEIQSSRPNELAAANSILATEGLTATGTDPVAGASLITPANEDLIGIASRFEVNLAPGATPPAEIREVGLHEQVSAFSGTAALTASAVAYDSSTKRVTFSGLQLGGGTTIPTLTIELKGTPVEGDKLYFNIDTVVDGTYDQQNYYIASSPTENLKVQQTKLEADGIQVLSAGPAFSRMPPVLKLSTYVDPGATSGAFYVYGTDEEAIPSELTRADLADIRQTTQFSYTSVAEVRAAVDQRNSQIIAPRIVGTLQRDGNVYSAELRDLSISSEADRNLVATIRFVSQNEADLKSSKDYGSIVLPTLSQLVGASSSTVSESKVFNFKLGTAARDTDVLSFQVDGITTQALKLKSTSIISEAVAKAASAAITDAILKLSTVRANVGASQNRLEFASTNLATSIENTEAARSDLLDLDVASEMTNFTSKQILMQAGVAMLAQANQMPRELLKLFPNG